MRILFISHSYLEEINYRRSLSFLAEKDSIYFVYSIISAYDFINNIIEKKQEPLDLIILHNNVEKYQEDDFLNFIRNNKRTYSKRDFNLCEIPLILILSQTKNISLYKQKRYSDVFFDLGPEKLPIYSKEIISVIKSWRKIILDELDNLGIQLNSGDIDYSYFFQNPKEKKTDTKIISENFKRFPRILNYEWLQSNQKQIEISIDRFIKLLRRSSQLNKKKEEKLYHKFFKLYPNFLRRDNYSKTWYEVQLRYDINKSYKPDFTLRPNFNYQTDLSLIEVKLPNEGLVKSKSFHQNLYASLFDHLGQVNDYKDFLESDKFLEQINKRFGYIPKRVTYNLLIGREDDKEDNLEIITKRMRQFDQTHIHLMTYDELLEYQVQFMLKMDILEIK